ncbi:hypothetical protein KY312_02575 [Candidatus Woesearchaeota archaeon]|nr:hypothetical protein [Candidatus Woesearchaeota archaeon]
MEAKQVKVEVVEPNYREKKQKKDALRFLAKIKLGVALFLDGIDFLISWIPIINTLWDFVTFAVLFVILRNKNLAYFALGELVIPGFGAIGFIDGLIPSATIITVIDSILPSR